MAKPSDIIWARNELKSFIFAVYVTYVIGLVLIGLEG